MDDLPPIYEIQTVEQLRVIADSLRIRIFDELARRPMTVTQVGEALGMAPPRIHYHVREMERLGLVRLVQTRERGGILEKYYRAVARNLKAPPQLFQNFPVGEVTGAMAEFFTTMTREFLAATARASAARPTSFDDFALTLGSERLWMTPGDLRDAARRIDDLLKPFEASRGAPDEREVTLTIVGYDVELASAAGGPEPGLDSPSRARQGADAQDASEDAAGGAKRARPVVVVGVITYTRAELERIVANGEWLDLNVVGYLSFARDVTPDLVERAIHTLRYQGLISAPPEAREALRRKEAKEG